MKCKSLEFQQKLEFQVIKSKQVWNSRCGHVKKKKKKKKKIWNSNTGVGYYLE